MAKSRTTKTIKALLKLVSSSARLDESGDDQNGAKKSFLLFEVEGESFALPIEEIESIVDCPRITPLPYPPNGIIGVTSIHGVMILVMKLTAKGNGIASKTRLILIKGDAQLGLFTSRIDGIVTLSSEDLVENSARKKVSEGNGLWSAEVQIENKGRLIPVINVESLAES